MISMKMFTRFHTKFRQPCKNINQWERSIVPMSEEIKNEEIQTRKSWHPALNALLCAVLGLGGGYTGGRIAVHTQKTDGTVQESTEPTVVYTPVQTTVYAEGEELSIGQIVDKAADSVVEIRTTVKQTGFGFYGSYTTEGAGSGVIITSDGYIVTFLYYGRCRERCHHHFRRIYRHQQPCDQEC